MSDDIAFYPHNQQVAIIGGREVPIGGERVTAASIIDKLKTISNVFYSGQDPEKQGMTFLEAAIFDQARQAADGNLEALDKILNRLLGKPVQQVAAVAVSGTLQDFLDTLAGERDPDDTNDVDVIDVTEDLGNEDPFAD